jgi:hypothetical protein
MVASTAWNLAAAKARRKVGKSVEMKDRMKKGRTAHQKVGLTDPSLVDEKAQMMGWQRGAEWVDGRNEYLAWMNARMGTLKGGWKVDATAAWEGKSTVGR